jgi:hypothetical protein
MAVVRKQGKLVDIPVKCGTVVKLRESRSGRLTGQKALVVGSVKPHSFSRAYGRQVYVCTVYKDGPSISTKGAGDLYPVGRAKRVPKSCLDALASYKKTYESE